MVTVISSARSAAFSDRRLSRLRRRRTGRPLLAVQPEGQCHADSVGRVRTDRHAVGNMRGRFLLILLNTSIVPGCTQKHAFIQSFEGPNAGSSFGRLPALRVPDIRPGCSKAFRAGRVKNPSNTVSPFFVISSRIFMACSAKLPADRLPRHTSVGRHLTRGAAQQH